MSTEKTKLFASLARQAREARAEAGPDLEKLAAELVAAMTPKEKIGQMSGQATRLDVAVMLVRYNLTTYDAGGNRRLGIPPIRFTDGPRGITVGRSTCFPAAIARGATWNPDLEEQIGAALGREARAQGANFFGGVCVNVLRHPGWGRAQETYGEDPHLLGEMGAAAIRGARPHVMTCVKHFACNSIEESRFTVDVRIDEQALRQIYLPHFRKCVQAGADCVMSAYNRVNGHYCGHNRHLLTDILKTEWGFAGPVMSDFCYGLYDAESGVTAGLDLEMPRTRHYGRKLARLVRRGKVPPAVIDQAARRIVRTKLDFARSRTAGPYPRDQVAGADHARLAYQAACQSMVLLQNRHQVLPLARTANQRIAVLGRLADKANLGDKGSSRVRPPYAVTPLAGIRDRAGEGAQVVSYTGRNLGRARQAAAGADVIIIVAGLTARQEGEYFPYLRGGDRRDLGLCERDRALIRAVSKLKAPCIVVLEGGSAITVGDWRDQADAILMAWYPGMEGGHALADILFGEVTPGGRLPVTFFASAEQCPPFNPAAKQVRYDLFHGYRYADAREQRPAFYFGFGLSYTEFAYAGLRLENDRLSAADTLVARLAVTNNGNRPGDEVVQLYIEYPPGPRPRPVKELKAFARVLLDPGETVVVRLSVAVADLAWFSPEQGHWQVTAGQYTLRAGPSADPADLRLAAEFTVE
ncbi:MAG: glycoside hydrolase family 3 C-terminal domain-containing protein [Desulfosudaceae bacterium]